MNAAPKKIRGAIVDLLNSYLRAEEDDRTRLLRQIAEHLVTARSHFMRHDGSPDWKGRSYAYRVWIRDLYSDADVRGDDLPSIQSAIRYHVGAVLRARLDEDTLAEYELMPQSPRERSAGRRQERAAVLNALNARDVSGGALVALVSASKVLGKVGLDDAAALDPASAEVARAALDEISGHVRSIRRRVPKA